MSISRESKGLTLEERKLDLDAGLLGKIFGSPKNAPFNISGVVVILLVLSGVVYSFIPQIGATTKEFWATIAPIITMILGYTFGKK
jgi:hypothetical protein